MQIKKTSIDKISAEISPGEIREFIMQKLLDKGIDISTLDRASIFWWPGEYSTVSGMKGIKLLIENEK